MNERMEWHGASRRQIAEANLFERELFGSGRRPFGARLREDWESQERVIGTENRVQVLARRTNPSTTLFPFNTICHIDQGGGLNATGTLIAPRVVITANHVVQGLTTVTVTPGANFPAATAAEQRPASPASQASTTFVPHRTLDLALVFLPAAFTRPNRFMMLQPRGDINTATLLTIAGYPRIPPGGVAIPGSMWRHSDRLPITGVTATHLNYPIDTDVGQSGSPLWLLGNNEIRLLLGVHIQGGATANRGVRITCAVIDWIEAECRAASITPLPIVDNVQRRRVCPPAPAAATTTP